MTTTPPAGSERADHLARLLDDYSYPERRSPALLAEIDRLLGEAREEGALPAGASPAAVRAAIGPPHRVLGEEREERLDWHYPCLPPPGEPARGGEWTLVVRFRSGRLVTIERRLWREHLR